ncbi:hypothetical protein [Streptomyces sp. NPDC053560]|uniref:hypothetical protein n=1 Tax=Streptomyces sp. NPDC053560 TaxID=3365711 RepID=UPI0037D5B0E3
MLRSFVSNDTHTQTPYLTPERVAAWAAAGIAVLVAIIGVLLDVGAGNIVGATLIAYTGTVVASVHRFRLRPGAVLSASGRGAVIAAVIAVLLVVGVGRSALHLLGVG